MGRARLSVVMITKNEAALIADCLQSVAWADEVIVLDDISDDKTREIAASLGAQVYSHPKGESFGQQRQRAQQYATGDYIFMIDADERVTPELRHAIESVLNLAPSAIVYSCARRNLFLNRFMRHSGWSPDRVIRLYANQQYRYNNDLVHESLDCQGAPLVELAGALLHLTALDYFTFQRKQLAYAESWAKQHYKKGKRAGMLSAILHGIGAFIKTWLLRVGFLEGKAGLLLAYINAQYTFNKYAGLWALAQQEKVTLHDR